MMKMNLTNKQLNSSAYQPMIIKGEVEIEASSSMLVFMGFSVCKITVTIDVKQQSDRGTEQHDEDVSLTAKD